jgi:CDP-diacylglycerol--glycerol-3-phosphate 3-phosphatidyltransferase
MSDLPARWSRLHHGIEPAAVPFLRPWLQVVWTVAAPIARLRVPPIALTVIGAVLAVDAVLFARAQPWLALGLVALAAVADALDGDPRRSARRQSG